MNTYGNEFRIFCKQEDSMERKVGWAASPGPQPWCWKFVNSDWADAIVEGARQTAQLADSNREKLELLRPAANTDIVPTGALPQRSIDAGEMLKNPLYRAEIELAALEREGAAAFAVLSRIYPQIRKAGMHVVRKLRYMCRTADNLNSGMLPLRAFQGVLSWIAIRMSHEDVQQLHTLFSPRRTRGIAENDSLDFDYARFFHLMEPSMAEVRLATVQDAYEKLRGYSPGGVVEVGVIQRAWRPQCHPAVQSGEMTEAEAIDDFLRQWQLESADGTVPWQEFLQYYRDVSMAVEQDDVFVEIVRRGWDL